MKIKKTVPITQARNNLYKLLDETIISSEPIEILGKRGNGILLSKQDWISIQETLYLLSIPGMRESLIEGRNTSEEELLDLEDIGWDKKAKELLKIIRENPFQNPPPYEKLIGDLKGLYSKRINIQHRIVYAVVEGR